MATPHYFHPDAVLVVESHPHSEFPGYVVIYLECGHGTVLRSGGLAPRKVCVICAQGSRFIHRAWQEERDGVGLRSAA